MYSVIIVDDEIEAVNGLSALINNTNLDLKGYALNGVEAIDIIEKEQPDILLLDIQMPQIDGFEVLSALDYVPPVVIFITAYDAYALKAFEFCALDYILKPFSDERFENTLARAIAILDRGSHLNFDVSKIYSIMNGEKKHKKPSIFVYKGKIIIRDGKKLFFEDANSIVAIESLDYYIQVIRLDKPKIVIRTSLQDAESILSPLQFRRISRSAIVNERFIETIDTSKGTIKLTNDKSYKMSKNYLGIIKNK